MSSLSMLEKVIFEKLFDRGGYVLSFSDRTYLVIGHIRNILMNTE